MKPAVFDRWYAKTVQLEGYVDHMYLDVFGKVTTGVGNLIDNVGLAMALPWKLSGPDGRAMANVPAAMHEISQAWNRVKAAQSMKLLGGGNGRWAQLTDLRLTPGAIEDMVRTKLEQHEVFLKKRFPDYDTWPDNVVIAVNSLAWACGPAFAFPKLEDALRARDWHECAKECHIDDSHNPGVRPRNRWMSDLFDSVGEPSEEPTKREPVGYVSSVDPHETAPNEGPQVYEGDPDGNTADE